MSDRVAFEALIREVQTKSLVSGDRSTRIILEVDAPSDEFLADMAKLHRADQFVMAAIVPIESNDRKYEQIRNNGKKAIPKRKSRPAEGCEV